MGTQLVWFRRDLRLHDLPTLASAAAASDTVAAVFLLDDHLLRPGPRRTFLLGCLRSLDRGLSGRLLVAHGDPVDVVPALVRELDASAVHVSADHGPYGSRRDAHVERTLGGIPLVRTGSPYAVSPGRVVKSDGTPCKVVHPIPACLARARLESPGAHGPEAVNWVDPSAISLRVGIPEGDAGEHLPTAGERAALRRWTRFRDESLDRYDTDRDRRDLDGTSRLPPYLKFGCLHPRTLLHDLRDRTDPGANALRSELCWREFYGDVLHHRPDTARRNYNHRFDAIRYDSGPDAAVAFAAWQQGRTGFPIVDAGMRQLLAQGWMHNRVRMIVASFLTKDLHLPWWWGARYFMAHLVDGDLASNQHGWQWTAGCGTDAAPYFRVFNPTAQGERFDPAGDYVRRWVPELRGIGGARVHRLPDGPPPGYPDPIVDHAHERRVALARYEEISSRDRPIR